MTVYRKNGAVRTEAEAHRRMQAYADFINPDVDSDGVGFEPLDAELMAIFESGAMLEWEEETQREYDDRIAKEAEEAAELDKLKTDHEYFLDTKVRPLRDRYYYPWHNKWNSIPALWAEQTTEFITEAEATRQALKDFPASITEYMTDAELEAAIMALKPSYIS